MSPCAGSATSPNPVADWAEVPLRKAEAYLFRKESPHDGCGDRPGRQIQYCRMSVGRPEGNHFALLNSRVGLSSHGVVLINKSRTAALAQRIVS